MKIISSLTIGVLALTISFLSSISAQANIDTIVVSSNIFTPDNITIFSGDSVYFSGASAFHPVMSNTGAWTTFTTNTMLSTEIQTAGSYPYECVNHSGSGMTGVITVLPPPIPVYINELHYDNTGGDVNEGVEIAGPAGTDLSCYQVLFYNGSDSLEDPLLQLTGLIPDLGCGYGTVWFPKSGIQNGSPDGLALYNTCSSSVIQFLSYEGVFTALDGPAVGMTSTDIGVVEPGAVGESLQLTGTGSEYSDFTWSGPITSTYDQFNQGQIFCAGDTIISLVTANISVIEDTGVVTIEISIFNPSLTTSFTVDLVYSSGTALPANDFTFSTQTLTFPASDSSNQTATITIIDDTIPESAETIVLMLQNVSAGAKLGSDSILTIIIKGNDIIIPPCSDLFYSEYVEGTSNNKAIEVYNPRSDTVDLSTYTFLRRNGGSTTVNTYVYNGMLAPGDVFVIVNSGADSINLLPLADTTSTLTFYNGDDALAIVNGIGDTIDMFGDWGVDPGSNWPVDTGATNEYTLVRKASIQQGGLYWDVVANEWDVYAQNDFSNLGAHTMTPCAGATLTANFSVADGCLGDSTCFTDLSVSSDSSIVQWYWDYGDGNIDSSIQNPCHTYFTAAVYTVYLIVVDSNGNGDTTSRPVTIQAAAIVDAGLDQVVCADMSCIALAGSVTVGSTTGIWTTTGSGVFVPSDTDLSACYTPSTSDTSAGMVEIILTSTNNGLCLPMADTVIITLYQPPLINVTSLFIDSSTCGNSDGNITGITASSSMTPLTYDWVNGASSSVGSTVDLLLVPSDSYTLTVSDSLGCSTSVGPYVIVDQGAPGAPTVSSPAPYCAGDAIADLIASGSGGTLYWSTNLGMTDTLGIGDTFSSGATSTDTFYVAELGVCFGPATMVVITVNSPLVLVTTPDTSICTGDSTVISAVATGGFGAYSITWVGLGLGSTFSVSPTVTTTYNVSAVDQLGCTSNADSVTVDVLPPLSVNAFGTATICAGDVATLSVTATGGLGAGSYSYSWSSGQTTSSITVTPSATTTYTVAVSDGCSPIANDATTVTVNPTPTAVFSSSTTMLDAVFTNASTISGGGTITTWGWVFDDGNTSTAQNPSNTYTIAGTYNVCLTVTSDQGCTNSTCYSVNVTSVGIAEKGLDVRLNIYPNPNNSGLFYLQIENVPSKRFNISVYNSIGKELIQSEYEKGQLPTTIDLNGHGPGVYYLRLTNKTNNINRKIIFIK